MAAEKYPGFVPGCCTANELLRCGVRRICLDNLCCLTIPFIRPENIVRVLVSLSFVLMMSPIGRA